jgi:hypothetical protein
MKEMKRGLLMFIGLIFLVAAICVFLVLVFLNKPAYSAEKKGASSFFIMGYGPREFAIKGEVERKLNDNIKHMEIGAVDSSQKLYIWIEGYADKVGLDADNDDWGDKRARQVKSFLSRKFPKAKIEYVSRGTSKNIRAVFVEWKYVLEKKKFDNFGWLVMTIFAALIGFLIFLHLFVKCAPSESPPNTSGPRWMNVEVDGELCSVQVIYDYEQNEIVSPFKTKQGFKITEPISASKRMESSLRRCLKREEFAEQRRELLRSGKIKISSSGNR